MSETQWLFLFAALGAAGSTVYMVEFIWKVRSAMKSPTAVPATPGTIAITKRRALIAAGLCLISLVLSVSGFVSTFVSQDTVTSGNVEAKIKNWLDDFSYSVRVVQEADTEFSLSVAPPADRGGRSVLIQRPRAHPNDLAFQGAVKLADEFQDVFNRLSDAEKNEVVQEVTLELARARVVFFVDLIPSGVVHVQHHIPITSAMTEETFIGALDTIDQDVLLANQSLVVILKQREKELTVGSKDKQKH